MIREIELVAKFTHLERQVLLLWIKKDRPPNRKMSEQSLALVEAAGPDECSEVS